jgi:hypothetical protein
VNAIVEADMEYAEEGRGIHPDKGEAADCLRAADIEVSNGDCSSQTRIASSQRGTSCMIQRDSRLKPDGPGSARISPASR